MSKVISREDFHYYLDELKKYNEYKRALYKLGIDAIEAPNCEGPLLKLLDFSFNGNQDISYFCCECDFEYPFEYWLCDENETHVVINNEDEFYNQLLKEMEDENK